MAETITFGESGPLDRFHNEPHIVIYDPGKHIRNPHSQLNPFDEITNIQNELHPFINQIETLKNQQLFTLLIFPNKNGIDVRHFLMRYSSIQEYSHGLYLIFPNGIQYHEKWFNTPSMSKLRWCRSFTTRLIWDILDVCSLVCVQRINFYEQRRIQAEDDIEHNDANSAESIATLFATKKKQTSILLFKHFYSSTESDD